MYLCKKWWMVLVSATVLFSGCGKETAEQTNAREVSSDVRYIWKSGLLADEGEFKESGVIYEDAPMEFCDEAIEEMLRNILEKPEGEIYISDLQKIHAIYWRHDSYWSNLQSPDGKLPYVSGCEAGPWETKQPESLADLAYCYNLQWMEFGGVRVPSLEPLLGLPQLESLGFEGAKVTEEVLEEIGKFPSLKKFRVGNGDGTQWGHLTDGSFLLPLARQLTVLEAEGGIDWNPDVLSQMTEVEKLVLHYGNDLSFFEHMKELKNVHLYCCTPTDWSPLGALERLEGFELGGNYKTIIQIELEDLCRIENLDYLEITYTSINEKYSREEIIEALPGLTGLVTELW